MQDDVVPLIAATYSTPRAEEFKRYLENEGDRETLASIGKEVLWQTRAMPPGACTHLSAIWLALIEERTKIPAYVVAGDFFIGDYPVFQVGSSDLRKVFDSSLADWPGHCWIVAGPYIGDISIFRTARARPPESVLRQHFHERFGESAGLMLSKATGLEGTDLRYVPRYALSSEQVTALVHGAGEFFKNNQD